MDKTPGSKEQEIPVADPMQTLKAMKRKSDFFVGIDSDGCAFDSMEIKHKECFIPNIVNYWDMQAISRFAREAAEFVNLYSEWRGINRFPALLMVFDLCAERPECVERGYTAPPVDSLRKWVKEETRLGNPALEAKAAATRDGVLARTLEWSKAVNETIERIVRNVPPFPHVRPGLRRLQEVADVVVVSATPGEALEREWREHDIARYARMICGQEMGSKKEHLQYGAGGKYDAEKVLMIGDAPGDLKAAKANGILFYPVNPGREEASWQRFHDEALDAFLDGRYAGGYEKKLIEEFMTYLPSTPPWKS